MQSFVCDSPAFDAFLKNNPHERGEVNFLNSIAEEGMNVIDIGANIGVTAVTVGKKIGKGGRSQSLSILIF